MSALAGAFAESLRATFQPCTFLLIVPVTAAVIAARATWQALIGACVAATIGGWVLVDNSWILDGRLLRVAAVLVVASFALAAVPRQYGTLGPIGEFTHLPWVQAALAAVVTLIATMWWRPCVGVELGAILNGADEGLAGELFPMAVYMLGAMLPIAVVVAARYAFDLSDRLLQGASFAAALFGAIVATSLVFGQHGRVVETLTRWTLE